MINLPELKELQFCEKTHTYTVNGLVVPSVSEIMKPLSAAHYGGIDTDTLNKAANRGTIVHAAVENYLLFGIEDISKELRGYFDGFKKWIDEVKPVPIKTECRIYHKTLNYAGTADLPCYIDDVPTLVDFKTTATVAKVLTRVQLEAYKITTETSKRGALILDVLGDKQMTVDEIVNELIARRELLHFDRNFVAPRLTELKEAGIVKTIGKRKSEKKKKNVAVWARVKQD